MKIETKKIRSGLIWSAFLLLLGIAMLGSTSNSYGQLIAQENLLSRHQTQVVNYTTDYSPEISWIEDWMIVPFQSSFLEEEISLESWMTVPFESGIFEEELTVETWMTVPFGTDFTSGI